jgi:hypothetical protein
MIITNRSPLLEAATEDPLAHSFANGPQGVGEQPDMGISASMKKGRTRSTREGLLRVRVRSTMPLFLRSAAPQEVTLTRA